MIDQSDRPDGDGLPCVNARVQQSGVYGGTRQGTIIKSTADTFTVKWDAHTIACTYSHHEMQGDDAQCPITVLATPSPTRDGAVETWRVCPVCGGLNRHTAGCAAAPPKPAPAIMRERFKYDQPPAPDARRDTLEALSIWCSSERHKIRGRGGFDDQTELEIGIGIVEAEIDRRAKALYAIPTVSEDRKAIMALIEKYVGATMDLIEGEGVLLGVGDAADAILSLPVQPCVGDREPTPNMRIAGGIAWTEAAKAAETFVDCADACWKAMWDAR